MAKSQLALQTRGMNGSDKAALDKSFKDFQAKFADLPDMPESLKRNKPTVAPAYNPGSDARLPPSPRASELALTELMAREIPVTKAPSTTAKLASIIVLTIGVSLAAAVLAGYAYIGALFH